MKVDLIAQGDSNETILNAFNLKPFDRMDVAVAYATLSGLDRLKLTLGNVSLKSRWVIGLDDGVTQPKAIRRLVKKKNASVRLASLAPARRFHPKFYCFWSTTNNYECVAIIGSGNLTNNGLVSNAEMAVRLQSENETEANSIKERWGTMWDMGVDFNEVLFDKYHTNYRAEKDFLKKMKPAQTIPLDIAPSFFPPTTSLREINAKKVGFDNSHLAWIEAGTPSAGGCDLEFPRDMFSFFDISNSPEVRRFTLPDGQVTEMTFTMREDNSMWRLLFSRHVLSSLIGRETMRPLDGGNRSDLIVVFTKLENDASFFVQLVKLDSKEHLELRELSENAGEIRRTIEGRGGREFGCI